MWFNTVAAACWKHLRLSLFRFVVVFIFLIQPGEWIYEPLRLNLFYEICGKVNQKTLQ